LISPVVWTCVIFVRWIISTCIYTHFFTYAVVFLVMILRSVVASYQCFKGTYCLHFYGTNESIWENNFLFKEVWSFKLYLICFLSLPVPHKNLLSQHGSYVPLCPSEILVLALSDPTSDLVRHYDFPVPLQCRKTSDTFFCCVCLLSAVGACPTLFLM
jgi:hypothetical protein